jgi:hypothetical protein
MEIINSFMPAKQRKRIRVEQLRKISINEIIYSGSWIRQFGDTTVELIHYHDGIRLLVNGCLQPVCWRIYELWRDVYDNMPFPVSTQAISALSAG